MTEKSRILVLGDASVDWHIIQADGAAAGSINWQSTGGHITARPGGSRLLQALVDKCLAGATGLQETTGSDGAIFQVEEEGSFTETMTICKLFLQGPDSKQNVLRVESLCGFKPPLSMRPVQGLGGSASPHVVVIDDSGAGNSGAGIRTQAVDVLQLLKRVRQRSPSNPPWIILKLAWPLLTSQLLKDLCQQWAERLIVVAPVDDLRRDSFQISRGLSWERTAQDLSWEFNYNPRMKLFAGIHALVVPLGLSGVWYSRWDASRAAPGTPSTATTLVYDPGCIEGDWEKDRPGLLLGYTSCLTLAIARELTAAFKSHKKPKMTRAAQSGLSMMRALHTNGYRIAPKSGRIELPLSKMKSALHAPLKLPEIRVQLGYRHYSVPAGTQADLAHPAEWSILESSYPSRIQLFQLGMRIVKEGVDRSLGTIPCARFGGPEGLTTVDRNEVEAFRATYDLIQDYCRNKGLHKPLSLAVFGPPGSGKSFGVTQVANAVAAGSSEEIGKIAFNVSQFSSVDDLTDAFHRVRDIGLSGKMPLVFWDEFDSSKDRDPLYWLKMFLAPMQDGEFTQRQINHPIGRAIFVFAGGTANSIEELGKDLEKSENQYREAKVPDFKSRIRGCINMVGIDRSECMRGGAILSDPQYVIRRAVALRSILERYRKDVTGAGAQANIDDGVLKALLQVWEFKHGIRSLESIIQLCHRGDSGGLHRSSLPPAEVLALHVRSPEFLGLITADVEFQGETLERLAAAHHEIYREVSRESPLAHVPYAQLSPENKEKNRVPVRGIPHKLASIGYMYEVLAAGDSEEPEELADAEAEHLARLEHDRWILDKIDDGFVYGGKGTGSAGPRTSPDLVPWDAISAEDLARQYPHKYISTKLGPGPLTNPADMGIARQIPRIMRDAGYRVYKL